MIEDGSGLIVGTATADGEPRATRAWAVTLGADARHARVVVTADDATAVAGLRHGRIALTAAHVRTLRSVQLKGTVTLIEPVSAADLELMDHQTDAFFTAVHQVDGNPVEQLRRMLPHEVLAVEFDIDERFDQTPGPRAGDPLGGRS